MTPAKGIRKRLGLLPFGSGALGKQARREIAGRDPVPRVPVDPARDVERECQQAAKGPVVDRFVMPDAVAQHVQLGDGPLDVGAPLAREGAVHAVPPERPVIPPGQQEPPEPEVQLGHYPTRCLRPAVASAPPDGLPDVAARLIAHQRIYRRVPPIGVVPLP